MSIIRNLFVFGIASLLGCGGTGGPGGSDHSAFIRLGIEALALMTSGGVGHPYYHRPEDDTEKIDAEILRKTGQFVLQGTINLAEERDVELLIEDRQNIYNAMQFNITSFNPGQGNQEQVEINARTKADLVSLVLEVPAPATTAAHAWMRANRHSGKPPGRELPW